MEQASDEDLDTILARLRAVAEERADGMARRPCHALEGKKAIEACMAVSGSASCEWSRDAEVCPIVRRLDEKRETLERIQAGRIDAIHAAELRRWLSDSRGDATRRIETDSLRLVRAFLSRAEATVRLQQTIDLAISFRGDEWCLILSGGVGVGKSLAAAWGVAKVGGLILRAPECARLDDQDDEMGEAIGAVISRARRTPLLVLDDLGTEHDGKTGWASGRISDLLIARHARQLPTICTTNLERRGGDSISERYGARVDDRLRQGGIFVGIGGPSLRCAA